MNKKIVHVGVLVVMGFALLSGSFALATGYSTFGLPSLTASVLTAFKIPYSFYEQRCTNIRYGYKNKYGYTQCQSIHRYGYQYQYRYSYGYSVTPVVPPITINKCVPLTTNIRLGSNDAQTRGEVTLLQKFLLNKGYSKDQPNGFVGTTTITALRNFQRSQHILVTDNVGPLTRARINLLNCIK